jgi:hypothetical protein
MPVTSPYELAYEIFVAISAINSDVFSTGDLVKRINENRKERGKVKGTNIISVNKVLSTLWLPMNVRQVSKENWEKGTGPIRGLTYSRQDIVQKIIDYGKLDATPSKIAEWILDSSKGLSRKAYICYPYRSNPFRHSLELLVLLSHLYPKAKDKYAPATPHEMGWGSEEKKGRRAAMNECADLIKECDLILFCLREGDTPSEGMKEDIEIGKKLGKPLVYIEKELGYYPNVEEIMKKCGLIEVLTVSPIATVAPVSKK